jgi:mono/diheme cytochrome c family protein
MRTRSLWPALACLAAGFGLSLLGVVAAQEAGRRPAQTGEAAFQSLCSGCHGEGDGTPVVPLPRPFEYDANQVRAMVRDGRGEMPAFSAGQIGDAEIEAVAEFLRSGAPR